MDFGLFYYCQGRGVPHDQAYAEMLDQIELAESLGFGECWFAEHHFTDYSLQGFWYLSSLASPPLPADYSDARLKELTTRVWGGPTYDELEAIGGMLIGTPAEVAAKVKALESIGVDTLLLVCSFGNLEHAQVCRSLQLFADAVIS